MATEKKMYYSEEETIEKLGITSEELQKMVQEGKLHAYLDGGRKVYKAEEVDALSPQQEQEQEVVELTPAEDTTQDVVSLSEAEKTEGEDKKEETVISSEGITIFDEEDLEVPTADPMAKTTIAPGLVEDEISLEGAGSGSGLLDLTRESDDTSLGAEVLEHIDMESAVPSSSAALEAITEEPPAEVPAEAEAPVVVEEVDPTSGMFSGLVIGACAVMLVLVAVVIAAMSGTVPGYVEALQKHWSAFAVIAGVVMVILAIVGYLLGKSSAQKAQSVKSGS